MIRIFVTFLLLLSPEIVLAQQEPAPSQMALQIDNIINSWAQRLELLQQQNTQLRARVKELEDKYEPKEQK